MTARTAQWASTLLLCLILACQAWGVEPRERLADPGLEARAREISSELRCLVCQNESIDDSQADLAHDIRVLVRDRLVAGDTNSQARQAVVDRYGEFVLLRPRVEAATWLLWFGPPALLALGFIGTFFWLRSHSNPAVSPEPLSAAEQARLADVMQDRNG
jgi:cytochrome c-type biogenesis protein CcmH